MARAKSEKPFQGTPKELNAGTLEKELNGKDLNYDLSEESPVGPMLRFNAVELRELPGCYSVVPLLYESLLVNLVYERDLLMTIEWY